MVALAHPTSVPDLTRHVAKEAFINALGDDKLQIRVMDKQPTTIEEALGIAGRLEAYECTLRAQGAPPSEFSKGEGAPGGCSKSKHVYTVERGKSSEGRQLQKDMQKLQKEFANFKIQEQGKVNRLLSRMLMCQLAYLWTKPTLGPVPVELLRDGA